ncbi:IS4 family transposase [Flavivirga spongiicola]|uniref:IS4 family transposase n=1 Tax=Flavivirga spongiicola TaxID=421621 RepID=A0ABU7XR15_9FLAO|nr:IS4 family transposase [Flavivirga sp. MEBiC05379]MDO5978215.1 IS4 family transposase [Flavivirga sp. MEBiC05379]
MIETINPQHFYPDYTGKLGDLRSERRGMELWGKLSEHPSSTIRQLASNKAEQKAYYRFLNNDRINEEDLIKESSGRMSNLSKGRHLLCLQDTCEVNLSSHKGRLNENSGLGQSDKSGTGHCFKLHPGLVLDIQGLNPLGFSHIKVFHRPEEKPDRIQRNYKRQPIIEKESYKWIEVAQTSKAILKESATVTFIEDREGDIYEQFAMVPDEKTHLLIRSRATRNLSNGNSLYKEIDSEPVAGTYSIELSTDRRKNQYKRQAEIALRFKTYEVMCPANLKNKGYPEAITLSCISVKEISKTSKPINWKLLTTHKIEKYEDALLMVEWYNARWYIEQLFRVLKKQGFGIEETELENGWAIRKLVIMQMTALLKILQMNIAYADSEGGQPIEEVFDKDQIEVLEMMNTKLQGKSMKLQNHHNPQRTKWAAWVVGRIGGWKG